ncbi:hypothetical protein WJX73_010139 [Symbiochloris irregularis]|uniref:Uncharacterized protein n=1 Tax=Symbiochloris irregularis TaxID=706552 RepID=A0AAW1PI63_9CHLO
MARCNERYGSRRQHACRAEAAPGQAYCQDHLQIRTPRLEEPESSADTQQTHLNAATHALAASHTRYQLKKRALVQAAEEVAARERVADRKEEEARRQLQSARQLRRKFVWSVISAFLCGVAACGVVQAGGLVGCLYLTQLDILA